MDTLPSLSLGLNVVLACITMVVTKHCYYCDVTNVGNCVGIPMHCGEEENCYFGQGTAPGIMDIINKACVAATHCGRKQSINYLGVTYNFTTFCCHGNLCNASPPGTMQVPPRFTTIIAGLSLTLLLN